jgi:tetratricopeptide (TPR) repeat protein
VDRLAATGARRRAEFPVLSTLAGLAGLAGAAAIATAIGHSLHHGRRSLWHSFLDAIGSIEVLLVLLPLALFAVFGAVRRIRLWHLVRAPGPIQLTGFEYAAAGDGHPVPAKELAADFSRKLADVQMYTTSGVPGALPSGGFLQTLRSARLDTKKPLETMVDLLAAVWPPHGYEVRVTLLERDGRRAAAAELTELRSRRASHATVSGDDWDEVVTAAAHFVTARIIPHTRDCRLTPWAGWIGQEIPLDVFTAYQQANAFARARRYDEALASYHRALDADPDNREIRYALGLTHEKLSLHLDALLNYYRLLKRGAATSRLPRRVRPHNRVTLLARYRFAILLGFSERLARQWLSTGGEKTTARLREGTSDWTLRDAERERLREQLRGILSRRYDDTRDPAFATALVALLEAPEVASMLTRLRQSPLDAETQEALRGLSWKRRGRGAEQGPSAAQITGVRVALDTIHKATLSGETKAVGKLAGRRGPVLRAVIRLTVHELLAQPEPGTQLGVAASQLELRLRHLFQLLDEEEVRRLVVDTRRRYISRSGTGLSRAAIAVTPHWARLRRVCVMAERPGVNVPAGDAAIDFGRRLGRRLRRSRRFIDHYNAACTYAILLRPVRDHDADWIPHSEDWLASMAVEHLRAGLRRADASQLSTWKPWILGEDPDLEGLRGHIKFVIFQEEYFPSATRPEAAPREAHRLQQSRQVARLLEQTARRFELAWHTRARRADGSEIQDVREWWRRELEAWGWIRRFAIDHRHWQTRARAIDEIKAFVLANDQPRFAVAPLVYADRPLAATDEKSVEELLDETVRRTDAQFRQLARWLGERHQNNGEVVLFTRLLDDAGPANESWHDHLRELDRKGQRVPAAMLRDLCERRATVWGALADWFGAHMDVKEEVDRAAKAFRIAVQDVEFPSAGDAMVTLRHDGSEVNYRIRRGAIGAQRVVLERRVE